MLRARLLFTYVFNFIWLFFKDINSKFLSSFQEGKRGYLEGLAAHYAKTTSTPYEDVLNAIEKVRLSKWTERHVRIAAGLTTGRPHHRGPANQSGLPNSQSQPIYVPGKYLVSCYNWAWLWNNPIWKEMGISVHPIMKIWLNRYWIFLFKINFYLNTNFSSLSIISWISPKIALWILFHRFQLDELWTDHSHQAAYLIVKKTRSTVLHKMTWQLGWLAVL